MSWVRGEKQADVFDQVERVVGTTEYRGRLEGWRQLTEVLSWKARFLAKMLGTARAEEVSYSTDEERQVLSLAARLRLGCTAEAVPLFWPQSSNISRRDAVSLLEAGMTPGKIVSLAEPQRTLERAVRLKPTRLDALRGDLERYAVKEFVELEGELTLDSARRQGDNRARSLYHLWHETSKLYRRAVEGFGSERGEAVEYDALLRQSFDTERWRNEGEEQRLAHSARPSDADGNYRVRIEVNSDELGVVLSGEVVTGGKPKRRHGVRVVGVQMRRDWMCHLQGGRWVRFADLLSQFKTAKNVVFVALPWTPYHGEIPSDALAALTSRQSSLDSTCAVVTPAAFSVMMSAVLRNFTDGEEMMTLLTVRHQGFSFVSLAAAHQRLQAGSVTWPESIREKIVSCFEVDPSVLTGPRGV